MSALLEGLNDGELVDFVNFKAFTRYPTPVAGQASSVEFDGEIVPLSPASYDSWSVQQLTTTIFRLFKNGVKDSDGEIGVQHTSDDDSIVFTLGSSGDTFSSGDQWSFITSAFIINIKLSKFEFMELARDSDLEINIFYPGELEIGD